MDQRSLSLLDTDCCIPSTFDHGQSYEELKHLFVCATLELESTRAAARAQGELHEARVRHLEGLLKTTRRERDEAREQFLQMQGRLSRSPSRGSGLSDGIATDLSGVQQVESVSSLEPTRATLSEVHRKIQEQQQLELRQNQRIVDLDSLSAQDVASQRRLEQLHQRLALPKEEARDQLVLDIHSPDKRSAVADVHTSNTAKSTTWSELPTVFPARVDLPMHSGDNLHLDGAPTHQLHMEISHGVTGPQMDQDLQTQIQQLQEQQLQHFHSHLQQRLQESDELLSQLQHQSSQMSPMETADQTDLQVGDEHPGRSTLSESQNMGRLDMAGVVQNASPPWQVTSCTNSSMPIGMQGVASPALPASNRAPVSCFSDGTQLRPTSCLQSGSAVASILSPLERFGDSPSRNLLPPRPMHLPEPPESDPQFMLDTLPEKGKLLQAVMAAGPLLKTLLVAGQLPQWRHPPPALDSLDIPCVSMGAQNMLVAAVEQKPNAMGQLTGSHGSSSNDHAMHLSNSLHANLPNSILLGSPQKGMRHTPQNGRNHPLAHSLSLPNPSISSILPPFDSSSPSPSPVSSGLCSERSLPIRDYRIQALSNSSSHFGSHDVSRLGPPLKYAKIH